MIDINELRRLAQAATPGPWKMLPVGDGRQKFAVADSEFLSILTVTDEGGETFGTVYDDDDARFIAAANPATINELLDRLEAAEKERDALRAKIERMEKQQPYCWTTSPPTGHFSRFKSEVDQWVSNGWETVPLYLAPGAQPELNLSDPAVQKRLAAQWGYVPAGEHANPIKDEREAFREWFEGEQGVAYDGLWSFAKAAWLARAALEAHSAPEGWLRAIDEALAVTHIGVASADDTYEQAKAKLDNLIGFHFDLAMIADAPEAKP